MGLGNRKFVIAGVVFLLIFICLALVLGLRSSNQRSKNTVVTENDIKPPSEAINLVTRYIEARENSVGADQATPFSWLETIKPMVADTWFKQLQPSGDVSTSSTSNEFGLAHENGFVVKTELSNCLWVINSPQKIVDKGTIKCTLTDKTVRKASGAVVTGSDLPFGWSRSGQQLEPVLNLVKQHGTWIIASDQVTDSE